MNYRHHLQEAERLLKGKHYASCVQKCAGIFEVAFKELYQHCLANIESMVEKKEVQRIEEEIGKNQRTFQKFGFGELVGLARKAKLFERLKKMLKRDLDRINTINFGSLVEIRNRITHRGADVQEIDSEIFLTGLRTFLLDTQLIEPVLSLAKTCQRCGNDAPETARHCPHCGAGLEKTEPPLSCPSCGAMVRPDWVLCPQCGAGLKPETSNCPECGEEVQSDWKICPFCGAARTAKVEPVAVAFPQAKDDRAGAAVVFRGGPGQQLGESAGAAGVTTSPGLLKAGSRKLAVVALFLLVAVVAGFLWVALRKEPISSGDAGGQGFRLMHLGQLAQAEAAVQSLSPKDPRYWEGWSALHLSRGELEKAQNSYRHLLEAAPARPYAAVLQGHLALFDGNPDQAEAAYHSALSRTGLEPWQQAECHFGLGRINLQRNAPDKALQQFNLVLQLDPSFAQAYTAKGVALERLGELHQAVAYYEKAERTNPDDDISASLAQISREKLQAQAQEGRLARIDALVEDFAKAYRENPLQAGGDEDEWSSKPLYLFFTDLEVDGQPALREGQDTFIAEEIMRQVGQGSRIHLVEREILDKLLTELKLVRSQITDKETAPRLGKILSARIIAAGSIVRYAGEMQITLRAVDTESTFVTVITTDVCAVSENPKAMLRRLALEFQERIMGAYPIRARISALREGEVTLNVGSLVGVKPGMILHLAEPDNQGLALTVKDVHQKFCTAVTQAGAASLQVGWRVEGT